MGSREKNILLKYYWKCSEDGHFLGDIISFDTVNRNVTQYIYFIDSDFNIYRNGIKYGTVVKVYGTVFKVGREKVVIRGVDSGIGVYVAFSDRDPTRPRL